MDMTARPKEGEVAGRLLIRITPVTGEITDLRYQHLWSAWLDGTLLGKGYCAWPEQARELALDLVTPEQVTSITIEEPEPQLH